MTHDLWRLSAVDLARGIRQREYSVGEVVESVLARIESLNPRLNAISFDCSADASIGGPCQVSQWLKTSLVSKWSRRNAGPRGAMSAS